MAQWDHLFQDEELPEEIAPRRRGRPTGTKNTPQEAKLARKRYQTFLKSLEESVPDKQKEYVSGLADGSQDLDALSEMKLLIGTMRLLFHTAACVLADEGKVTKEISEAGNTLRMSIKDYHDMNRYEEEKRQKQNTENDLVRVADGRATVEGLEALIREYSTEQTSGSN